MAGRILIVDDDPVCLTAYKSILQEHFSVSTANSASCGLDQLKQGQTYAVVISDMHMPDMDGVRFLAEVDRLCPDTIKIMLTGYANLETAMAAVNSSHVFGFYSKSCDADALISAVRKALAQYKPAKHSAPKPYRATADILSAEEIDFLTRS